jgi:IclR family acetate operon transcriptional repressor
MLHTVSSQPSSRNQSSSLRRALSVLHYVSERAGETRGVPLSRIAEDLKISKSSVLRLTTPLLDTNLLIRDRQTGWFRLGHGALRLGQAYLASLDLRTVAAEPLRRMQRALGETCHLVVYEPPDVVYIDKVENDHQVRMASRIGNRVPAYRTAVGKAILAWLPEEAVQAAIDRGLNQVTERTLADPSSLRADLSRIRRRGYAIDDRENEEEVRCIAAPIFDHSDDVIGALSVSALASRMKPARVREVGPIVLRYAIEISRVFGSAKTPTEVLHE